MSDQASSSVSAAASGTAPTLDELRQKIDQIDETIHRQLIERSEIVESLIAVKRTDKPGAAFRPGREVNMMRRLIARHRGILPITTVEHLWREIIATFTHMQAPYDVVVEPGSDIRDVARFYFGFTVGFEEKADRDAVKAHVIKGAGSVLGVVGVDAKADQAWWKDLSKDGLQVIARLPVIAQKGRPVDHDAFVLSMPLMDTTVPDIRLVAMCAQDETVASKAIEAIGGEVVSTAEGDGCVEILAGIPFSVADVKVESLTGLDDVAMKIYGEVGGYWQPLALEADEASSYEASS